MVEVRGRALPPAFVAAGLLTMAAVEFFEHPIDARLYFLTVFVFLGSYAVALACAATAVTLAYRHGTWRRALAVALVSALATAVLVPLDLDRGYPWAYFHLHRQQFAVVAGIADGLVATQAQRRTIYLPRELDLIDGSVDVVIDDGEVVLELLMSMVSGYGYAYVHAPLAHQGDEVDAEEGLRVVDYLGDGWWWAET